MNDNSLKNAIKNRKHSILVSISASPEMQMKGVGELPGENKQQAMQDQNEEAANDVAPELDPSANSQQSSLDAQVKNQIAKPGGGKSVINTGNPINAFAKEMDSEGMDMNKKPVGLAERARQNFKIKQKI